jgi:hypothetical protein
MPSPVEALRAACQNLAGFVKKSRRFDDAQRIGVRMFTATVGRATKVADLLAEWQLLRAALNSDALLNEEEAAAVKQLKTTWRESYERELAQAVAA